MLHSSFDPQNFATHAQSFGHKLKLTASARNIFLQQYECVPGGWQHDPIYAWRIAVQDKGKPKMERAIGHKIEQQTRPSGTLSISPAEAEQRWSWDSSMQVTLLFIEESMMDELGSSMGVNWQLAMRTPLVQHDNMIRYAVSGLTEHYMAHRRIPRLLLESAGQHIAAHLISRYLTRTDITPRPDHLSRRAREQVFEFVEANLHEDIGLDDLAAAVGMTPHYFCRAFRLSVGIPPYRYFISRRIERAKMLLCETDDPITKIAFDLGFASSAHFSTAFRKLVDCSPTAYRKAG